MEILDIVNKEDIVIGKEERENINKKNIKNYRVVNAIIVNSKKQIILAKRSMKKKYNCGKIFFSVGGHVNSGEDYNNAMKREIKEELGFEILDIEEIGYFSPYIDDTSSFAKVYKVKYDGNFVLDYNEIEEMCYFKLDELNELIRNYPEKFSSDFCKMYSKIRNKLT